MLQRQVVYVSYGYDGVMDGEYVYDSACLPTAEGESTLCSVYGGRHADALYASHFVE